jgi:hypothetical protein
MNKIEITIQELFYFLSISIAILALLELVWPGLVSAYLNLNYILILWLISGMIILLNPNKNDR